VIRSIVQCDAFMEQPPGAVERLLRLRCEGIGSQPFHHREIVRQAFAGRARGRNKWNTDSYFDFGTSGSTINAIAADGVTPVILRWHLSQPGGTVTFSVADSTCAGAN